MNENAREQFMALLEKDEPVKSDVIFLAEGDGLNRVPHAANLYREGYAPLIAIVGGDTRREYGSFLSHELKEKLIEVGIPESAIYMEETSPNTKAEADRMMVLAKERGWKSILIVTSPHHQYRTFLTFLKSMNVVGLDLALRNSPAPLSWTEENPWGRRIDLLEGEWERIRTYQEKGDVASYEEGIDFLEKQSTE